MLRPSRSPAPSSLATARGRAPPLHPQGGRHPAPGVGRPAGSSAAPLRGVGLHPRRWPMATRARVARPRVPLGDGTVPHVPEKVAATTRRNSTCDGAKGKGEGGRGKGVMSDDLMIGRREWGARSQSPHAQNHQVWRRERSSSLSDCALTKMTPGEAAWATDCVAAAATTVTRSGITSRKMRRNVRAGVRPLQNAQILLQSGLRKMVRRKRSPVLDCVGTMSL